MLTLVTDNGIHGLFSYATYCTYISHISHILHIFGQKIQKANINDLQETVQRLSEQASLNAQALEIFRRQPSALPTPAAPPRQLRCTGPYPTHRRLRTTSAFALGLPGRTYPFQKQSAHHRSRGQRPPAKEHWPRHRLPANIAFSAPTARQRVIPTRLQHSPTPSRDQQRNPGLGTSPTKPSCQALPQKPAQQLSTRQSWPGILPQDGSRFPGTPLLSLTSASQAMGITSSVTPAAHHCQEWTATFGSLQTPAGTLPGKPATTILPRPQARFTAPSLNDGTQRLGGLETVNPFQNQIQHATNSAAR